MASVSPSASLKRKANDDQKIDYKLCIFCQVQSTEQLRTATDQGKQRVQDVARERGELNDDSDYIVLDQLQLILESDWCHKCIKWHHICYSKFTAKNKLDRLRKKQDRKPANPRMAHDIGSTTQCQDRISRSSQSDMNWSLCIFCQKNEGANIRNVATMNLSDKILSYAKDDRIIRIRLAGVQDLIAAEGKYHLPCFSRFERQHTKFMKMPEGQRGEIDQVMDELCAKLIKGLELGNIYDMGEVWQKYKQICSFNGVEPPNSYVSRRKTFNDSVRQYIGQKASFVRPLDMKASLLMYPSERSQYIIADNLTKMTQKEEISEEDVLDKDLPNHGNNILQELIHSALQVKNDLEENPGYSGGWREINQKSIKEVIPNSLYLFLSVLCGGVSVLEADETAEEDVEMTRRLCSIAQDIVFTVSRSRKLTPKHVGLGLTLHQATRSEQLVNIFHAAGHTISMDTIRRIDTSIATDILNRYELDGFVYIPEGIIPYETGRVILSSCDNIDVLEETIDGKNTFHSTQMVIWQRGPVLRCSEGHADVGRAKALQHNSLEKFHQLDHASRKGERPTPLFDSQYRIQPETWFSKSEERKKSKIMNEAWLLTRMNDTDKRHVPAWTEFNALVSQVDPPVTTIGMLPILQAPADNDDTMITVINRFNAITKKLGQKHTVLIGDQPLYSRAKELIWANPETYKNTIVLLGDLHILFNFLKVIGQHFENSGLADVWVESNVLAQNSTETVMNGKAYYRAIRGHTLAYEALSQIWWTKFTKWLEINQEMIKGNVLQLSSKVAEVFKNRCDHDDICGAVTGLVEALEDEALQDQVKRFDQQFSSNPNYTYWTNYLKMVEVLLDFIRANRDGNWELHLDAFTAMLPWMTIYDHTNYARWGPVYLADMKGLPITAPEIYAEFMSGNFVIKRSKKRFNQVPVDQATEWMNRMCKISNGIIGITRNETARDRFCVTWAERSHISHETKHLYGLLDDEVEKEAFSTRKDFLPSRRKLDNDAVHHLTQLFLRFNVFRMNVETGVDGQQQAFENDGNSQIAASPTENDHQKISSLISLSSNDVASSDIQMDLLTAEQRGITQVQDNVKERLINKTVSLFATIKRNNSRTFGNLYKCIAVNKLNEKKTIKADCKLMHKLFNALQAGRKVEMEDILKHELSPVPLSLAKLSGEMNSCAKSNLLDILTKDIDILSIPTLEPEAGTKSCVVIDGHALIQALGKPANCHTFDNLANIFTNKVFGMLDNSVSRVDVVFDRYIGATSIKAPTRSKRCGRKKPLIRKVINRSDLPLPQVWEHFISLDENKADLACFLSHHLIEHGKELADKYEVVTAGGFEDGHMAKSTRKGIMLQLQSDHEEADTRIILHALDAIANGYDRVLVHCQDTDVLLLMIHFLGHYNAEVWMMSGTSRQKKYYPINKISQKLSQTVVENILGFHALTGCDSTSSFTGFGNKTCWKLYLQHPHLLGGVGRDGPPAETEEFVSRLYANTEPVVGLNKLRLMMFQKGQKALEMLPPTKDAFDLHLARANFQAKIWLQANLPKMNSVSPCVTGGWKNKPSGIEIVWTLLPSVPSACLELISCGCKTKCRTAACKCYKAKQICLPACTCNAEDCCNPFGMGQSM